MEHDDEYRDEENQRRYEERKQQARLNAIYRDPFYPPDWAAAEFDEGMKRDGETD